MRELVEWVGDTYGEKNAYSFSVNPVKGPVITKSFLQLRDDVRGLATSLAEKDCSGKKCIIFGKYSYEWALVYFAVLSIGGVIVPLDKDWQGADLADTAAMAEGDFLFCDKGLEEKAAEVASKLNLKAEPFYLNAEASEENSVAKLTDSGKENGTDGTSHPGVAGGTDLGGIGSADLCPGKRYDRGADPLHRQGRIPDPAGSGPVL